MSCFPSLSNVFSANRHSATQASAPTQCPICVEGHNGNRVSLDSNVRQAQSFFPRLPPSFDRLLFRLGLCSPRPAPKPLSATAEENREIYRLFRTLERDLRISLAPKFQDHFDQIGLPAGKVESRHKTFDRKLKRGFANDFPRILSRIRNKHSRLNFSDALCNAYASTVTHVLQSLGPDFAGYAMTMKAPMKEVVSTLRTHFSPRGNPSSPTQISTVASAAAHAPAQLAIEPGVSLPKTVCEEFGQLRFEICEEIVQKYESKFEPGPNGRIWPHNAVRTFADVYSQEFDDRIPALAPGEVSGNAMQAIHREAMESAKTAAFEEALSINEVDLGEEDLFLDMLAQACREIDAKIARRSATRMAGLSQA